MLRVISRATLAALPLLLGAGCVRERRGPRTAPPPGVLYTRPVEQRTIRAGQVLWIRVLEAIAMVGGFSTFADKSDVRIVRRTPGGGEVEYRFDYDAYVRGVAPDTNIVLQPGDTIIVPD